MNYLKTILIACIFYGVSASISAITAVFVNQTPYSCSFTYQNVNKAGPLIGEPGSSTTLSTFNLPSDNYSTNEKINVMVKKEIPFMIQVEQWYDHNGKWAKAAIPNYNASTGIAWATHEVNCSVAPTPQETFTLYIGVGKHSITYTLKYVHSK